jgi:hypothetical protein
VIIIHHIGGSIHNMEFSLSLGSWDRDFPHPTNISILTFIEKFGTRFSNSFCLEYKLRNVFSKNIAEFTPEKRFELLV